MPPDSTLVLSPPIDLKTYLEIIGAVFAIIAGIYAAVSNSKHLENFLEKMGKILIAFSRVLGYFVHE